MRHHLTGGPERRVSVAAVAGLIALLACRADTPASTSPPTPSISVQLGSGALSIVQGQSRSISVRVSCEGGYAGGVALAITSAPAGVTATLDPSLVPSGAWGSMLTIAVDSRAAPGTYSLTLTGSGTGVDNESATLIFTVTAAGTPHIGVQLASSRFSTPPARTTSVAVTISRGGGFSGAVVLGVSGLPAGVRAKLDPTVVPAGEWRSMLTLFVGPTTTPGTYLLTLTGTGAGVASQATSFALTVTGLTLPRPPISVEFIPIDEFVWTVQGDSWTWGGVEGVFVSRSSGYAGEVNLTIEGLPPGVTATFNPSSLDASTTTSAVTFTATADAPPGSSYPTIRARGVGVPDATTAFWLIVFPPAP